MMKNWKYCLAVMASCVCAFLGILSCGDDDDSQPDASRSLFDQISAHSDLSTFKQILVRAGYDKVLSAQGTLTVLAPTNRSLASYDVKTFSDDLCLELAKRHVFPKAYAFSDLSAGDQLITNLLDESYMATVKEEAYKIPILGTGSTNPSAPINYNQTLYATITQADIACNNGSLNVTDDMIAALVVEQIAFHKKDDLIPFVNQIFQVCHTFENFQLKLEGLRYGGAETVHSITPTSGWVYSTEKAAYSVASYANKLIKYGAQVQWEDVPSNKAGTDSLIAQGHCLRAFAYYNLGMLWGRAMINATDEVITADREMNSQAEVFQFAYDDICQAIGLLPASDTQGWFTRDAALMLKAELELSMGRRSEAGTTLSRVSDSVSYGFVHPQQDFLPVYSARHLTLYRKEAQGDTDGLATEWAAMTDNRYGYWAALKRLGKAQELTGCYDYELLMPFYYQDVSGHPERQNPGYQ